MRTIEQLLSHLNALDVKLWVEGDRLRLNTPKGVLTPELRDELGARKVEVIAFLQSANSMSQLSASPIQSRAKDEAPPLSFSQQGLWFLDQFEPGSVTYNIPMAMRLQGTLDVHALHQALNEIVNRHEALRTTFSMVNEQPVQRISPPAPLPFPIINLQGLPEHEREAEADRLRVEEMEQPFDLVQGPVIRAKLLQLGAKEYLLLISKHHIVSDGWSGGIFIQELQVLYQAFLAGEPSPLPALPLQYADFAVWQRQWLQGPLLDQQLTYWKNQLGGNLPVLDLPLDFPRPPMQTFRGATQTSIFPSSLQNKLKALSQAEDSTLFMVLLAAFETLLSRYSGQEDVLIGTPVANRKRVELESLIGLFINTLVLRADLSGNPTVRELIARVRNVALEAYAHQDLPFELLVRALQPVRDPSRTPLFQTMFALENTPIDPVKLPGLTSLPVENEGGTAKFDLTLTTWEQPPDIGNYPEGLGVSIEYNTDLFAPDTITRMMSLFQTILEAMVADPNQHIFELPFLSQAERQQLLVEWNATKASYPREQAVHQLFEAQAKRTPESVAVVCGEEHLTYRTLNQRANQLAHHLQTLGVGPEVFVGIYMQRSVDMIVALLAILKAGGAYVPLDPTFPRDRLAYMIKDCQAKVLLTQRHILAAAPEHQAKVICIDSDWPEVATHDEQNATSGVKSDNVAYVIYTSGSTGKPKGVQIQHRSLVNFLTSMQQEPGLTEGDVLLSVTTISFDIAGLEIYLPLLVGAKVVIAGSADVSDGTKLLELMASSGATVMQATPSTWQLLLASGWTKNTPIKVLCGGEAMPRELADSLLERSPAVWNMYGPTETTVWSTLCKITSDNEIITIGHPIANTQIYILDKNLEPTPIGIVGEMYIGGDGVARGYLRQPALTAEKFVPDPFNKTPGVNMYRTGDQARYLADGKIDFLGRVDFQVKVRGFRIELGEIETVLNHHPDIRQAIVIVREDSPGDKRLVAYLIPEEDRQPDAGELRLYIRAKLPEYMIPSSYVFLDNFPMTPNRKVNRKALPVPDKSYLKTERDFIFPRTATEEKLAKIWATVLGIKKIDVYDSFFDLGGHSLLAVHMFTRINQEFGVNLPLATLFQEATIEHLANVINRRTEPAAWSPVVPINTSKSKTPLFGVHAQEGGVLFWRDLVMHLPEDQPFYAIQAQGMDGFQPALTSIEDMASLYISAIREIQPHGPYYLGGFSMGGEIAFEMGQQLFRQGERVDLLVMLDTANPARTGRPIVREDDGIPIPAVMPRAYINPIETWRQKADGHIRQLSRLNQFERLDYIRRDVRYRIRRVFAYTLAKIFRLLKRRLPDSILQEYLKICHDQAMRDYVPTLYPGRVTLFRSSESTEENPDKSPLGWGPLTDGRLDVFHFNASHNLVTAEYAKDVAQRLNECLIRARGFQ